MNFTFGVLDTIQVCGIPVELTKSQKQNYQIITQHWNTFNKKLREHKTNKPHDWVKYAITYKKDSYYYYMPCIPLNNSVHFKKMQIDGGLYATFEHTGNMALINKTLHHIYKDAIPNSSLNINPNRKLIHFERYDRRFNWNNPPSIIEIYIPILKQ